MSDNGSELQPTQVFMGSSESAKPKSNILDVQFISKEIDTTPGSNVIKIIEGVNQETSAQDIIETLNLPPYKSAIFVMGGAGEISPEDMQRIQSVLSKAISEVAIQKEGNILVGDGGTKSGVMIATGKARRIAAQYNANFSLVGVFPKEEVMDLGNPNKQTEIDPNHSHAVPVGSDPKDIGQYGAWGNETKKMYEVFGNLSEGKPSVGIVVNGGKITVNEVIENLKQGRSLIVLKGSKRAADNIVRLLEMKSNPFTDEKDFETDIDDSLRLLLNELDTANSKWRLLCTVVDLNQEKPEEALEDAILSALK